MNKETRKQLDDLEEIASNVMTELESVRDEEQDKFDNMPEGLQGSEKGNLMQEGIDHLEEAITHFEDAFAAMGEARGGS